MRLVKVLLLALLGAVLLPAMMLPQITAIAQPREQASVVVVFVDRVTQGEKEWVTTRIREFLGNKVNGLYRIVPGASFEAGVKRLNADSGADEKALFLLLADAGADYALVAELTNLKESGSMGMFRSAKNANVGLNVKILDLVNGGFLKQGRFTGKAIDDNTVVSVEDRLVALFTINSQEITASALDKLLFQVGEIISFNLPLAPPVKKP